jgi:uncharacterized protein with HEPN domain
MSPQDYSLLEDMLENAKVAVAALRGRNLDDLQTKVEVRYLTLHAVQLVGQAARHVSSETRIRLPALAWRDMVSTRNVIVHGYRSVDASIVLNIVQEHLPPLITAIERLFAEEPPQ